MKKEEKKHFSVKVEQPEEEGDKESQKQRVGEVVVREKKKPTRDRLITVKSTADDGSFKMQSSIELVLLYFSLLEPLAEHILPDAQRNSLGTAERKNDAIKVPADNRITQASSFDVNGKNELGEFMKSPRKEGRCIFGFEYNKDVALRMSARRSSTLESSIMNLEEVACRIRWLKGLLKFGFQRSDLIISSWKLLETGEEHL
ncbi:hypothetical protein KSP40_PGU012922 [Platanthera guangdongensis]|uniref:Uncharacterized protein n=1 Tax=Platanthera guangdongensis TaxID=2320717 RepID=A0ABR2MUQ0_9ASPA